jgi:mxaJ protein
MSVVVALLLALSPPLRVCADPNNLPFSNDRLEGFENALAGLIGRELDRPVRYTWWAQRRGFVRNTLGARACDVIMGVPAGLSKGVRATVPYYRSSYVFVSRRERGLDLRSFDAPALHSLRIGISLVGDDGNNPPPAYALARRGIVDNVVGYTVYGDYRQDSPPLRVMDALAAGEIDVAVVWGPLAGYYARRHRLPLRIVPVEPAQGDTLPFVFDVGLGVRPADDQLRRQLEAVLQHRRAAIDKLLEDYGVPQVH